MTAVRPLALTAILLAGLLALKLLFLADGLSQVFSSAAHAAESASAEQNQPAEGEGSDAADGERTFGELANAGEEADESGSPAAQTVEEPRTSTELNLLSRLAERRRALDAREAELDTREGLIEVAEQRVDARIAELRALERDIRAVMDELEREQSEQIDGIVQVYGALEPDAAAAIFEQMYEDDRETMLLVAEELQRSSARRFAAVMGEMRPGLAASLTSLLHARAAPPETVAEMEARLEAADG